MDKDYTMYITNCNLGELHTCLGTVFLLYWIISTAAADGVAVAAAVLCHLTAVAN